MNINNKNETISILFFFIWKNHKNKNFARLYFVNIFTIWNQTSNQSKWSVLKNITSNTSLLYNFELFDRSLWMAKRTYQTRITITRLTHKNHYCLMIVKLFHSFKVRYYLKTITSDWDKYLSYFLFSYFFIKLLTSSKPKE